MGAALETPDAPVPGASRSQPDADASPDAPGAGKQLADVLYFAWGPGTLARPEEGPKDGVSPIRRLAALMIAYDRFFPTIQEREGPALTSVADHPLTAVDDGWDSLRRPVVFFGTTAMGPDFLIGGLHSAAHVGGRGAQLHVLERYGHLDLLTARDASERVFQPIVDFVDQQLQRRGGETP
jgi:hypothetical protein